MKKKSRTIVIGPTNYNSYKKSLLIKNLDYLINNLLEKRKFKIVLRPHPSNINDALIKNIEKKFSNNKNFKVNFDKNYLNLYYNSLCLITDISGPISANIPLKYGIGSSIFFNISTIDLSIIPDPVVFWVKLLDEVLLKNQ